MVPSVPTLTFVKHLPALHPKLHAEARVYEDVGGGVDSEEKVAECDGIAEPQGHILLPRILAVIPVADVGGLVKVEDQPRQVAQEEDDDKA